MEKGIRQGCPLSALLFILSVECLSIKLRMSKNIDGIKIGDTEIRVLQYADDTTLTVSNNSSIVQALQIIHDFTVFSGLKLNMEKCEGLWLGTLRNNPKNFHQIKFNTETIKILGVYVGTDSQKCISKNWDPKLKLFQNLLLKWESRKITVLGKAVIINSLAIPLINFHLSVLTVPESILKQFENMIFFFLWGKIHKVKMRTVIGSPRCGGLGITDIFSKERALKASWIPRLIDGSKTAKILQMHLQKCEIPLHILLKMNFRNINKIDCLQKLPFFYKDVISAYHSCKYIQPIVKQNNYDFFSQVIWGNELFRFKDLPLCFKNWMDCGFILVKDLFDGDGKWVSENYVFNRLTRKQNWMSEYTILRKVISNIAKNFDPKCCKYINVAKTYSRKVILGNSVFDLSSINATILYDVLITKKFIKPYTENMWQSETETIISRNDWHIVYNMNTKLQYKKFAEFKYKILLNFLSCGERVNRWDKDISKFCEYCKDRENVSHMLFSCDRVRNIWFLIGNELKITLRLKHIVLGFLDRTQKSEVRNLVITIIAYSIYSCWNLCKFKKQSYKDANINVKIKKNLQFYKAVFVYLLDKKGYNYLQFCVDKILHIL